MHGYGERQGKRREPARLVTARALLLSPVTAEPQLIRGQADCGAQGRPRPEHRSQRGSNSLTSALGYRQRQADPLSGAELAVGPEGLST
jgi:hypothetical protein